MARRERIQKCEGGARRRGEGELVFMATTLRISSCMARQRGVGEEQVGRDLGFMGDPGEH
eukprot:755442-Hanusia_phi.AAC.1